MVRWDRETRVPGRVPTGWDRQGEARTQALQERVIRLFEALLKGALALMLYGSGTLVLSGVLFYFSWKLGLSALLVLSGLLPLAGSAYLLWRLLRNRASLGLWRYRGREAAVLRLAESAGGRVTVPEVALGTGLTLAEAEALLNELVRKGYIDLQVSPTGVLVYQCLPLSDAADKGRAESLLL